MSIPFVSAAVFYLNSGGRLTPLLGNAWWRFLEKSRGAIEARAPGWTSWAIHPGLDNMYIHMYILSI